LFGTPPPPIQRDFSVQFPLSAVAHVLFANVYGASAIMPALASILLSRGHSVIEYLTSSGT
jgi:hypothetical protein